MNTYSGRAPLPPGSPRSGGVLPAREPPVVSNAVLGTLMFVTAEAMLFAGLISAFVVVRSDSIGAWPPPGQPRLPVEATALNTLALLLSGGMLYRAHRAYQRDPPAAFRALTVTIGLGAIFVLFQGVEWVRLIGEGLTLTSSNHGSFFYLIVGMHALHALAALGALLWVALGLRGERIVPDRFYGAEVFWYFVVGLWPILYLQVYL